MLTVANSLTDDNLLPPKRGRGRSTKTLRILDAAITILEEIQPCSVRAVCYRLFTMGLITSMKKNETNKVSRLLTRAREDGLLPWQWIVDETRAMERPNMWADPLDYLETVKRCYRKDHWDLQSKHVEVWSEKGTIRGTIQPVLDHFGVPFRVMHGYGSATTINTISDACAFDSKRWVVFYIGDYDPSGLHMSEVDLPTRLAAYGTAGNLELRRLALTRDDVLAGTLPSFPLESKRLDPRHRWYRDSTHRYARGQCWELDALSPVVLRDRLQEAIRDELDIDQWNRSIRAEAAEQSSMQGVFAGLDRIFRQASKSSEAQS